MKKLTLTILSLLLLLGLSACSDTSDSYDEYLMKVSNSGGIKLLSESTEYEFGDVNINEGDISHTFEFMNNLNGDLILKGASTSCGCTSAVFKFEDGRQSPRFGMHRNPDWTYTVSPGEEFQIEATYDPLFHGPNVTGEFRRDIYVLSSSNENEFAITDERLPDSRVTRLTIAGNSLSGEEYKSKYSDNTSEVSVKTLKPEELQAMLLNKDFFLLDVHIPEQEHIPGTDEFIDYTKLRENADKLPEDKDEKIVIYCRSGSMSKEASSDLLEMGYTNVYDLQGGINAFNDLNN